MRKRSSFVRLPAILLLGGALAVATHSYAQNFAAAQWIPLTRNGVAIGDPAGDAVGPTDVVGDAQNPAAFIFEDASYLYFRLRVNGDPVQNGQLLPFGWACAVEADTTLTTYEFLSVVNGIVVNGPNGESDAVEWTWNQSTTLANDTGEPSDVVVGQFQRSVNARVVAAPSTFGGDPDFFVEWAIPLTTVRNGGNGAPGIPAGATLRFACGSSATARSYALDPACSLANAQCTLTNTWSDPIECGATTCGKDTDADGVMDHVEVALGTNPNAKDSDGDGILDNVELTPPGGGVFFPVDTDNDGTIDAKDLDSDNDCATDATEGAVGYRTVTLPAANPSSNCPALTPVCRAGVCSACDGDFGSATPAACAFSNLPRCNVGGPFAGRCTQCGPGALGQCTPTTPACSTQTGQCIACSGDFGSAAVGACPSAASPACQSATPLVGRCTQCSKTNTTQCGVATPTCDATTGTCATCNGDRGSGATRSCPDAAAPFCNLTGPDQGKCAKCTQMSQCGVGHTGPTCDVPSGACTDVDTDGDEVNDTVEALLGTDPTKKDTDGDGIDDKLELTPPGSSTTDKVDTDGDGAPDALDLDSDGDGVPDKDEGTIDHDGDSRPSYRDEDDDGDGVLTKDEVADTASAGVSDDFDGDGKKNWYDTDADGDGILDSVEGRTDKDGNGKPDYLDKGGVADAGADADAGGSDGGRAEAGIDGEGIEGNPVGPDNGVLEGGGFGCAAAPDRRTATFAGGALAAVLFALVLRRRRA